MTTVANPTLGKIEDIFKGLVWDSLVKAGISALFAAAPWMAIWPLGPIISFIITMFADRLFEALRLAVDLQAIAFVNEQHRREFDTAAVKLKILERDYGLESPEYKNAREEAKNALARFVHFNGA